MSSQKVLSCSICQHSIIVCLAILKPNSNHKLSIQNHLEMVLPIGIVCNGVFEISYKLNNNIIKFRNKYSYNI